jgi:3-oxoacyl-[acyl-carrier-protein] synthase-1
MAGDDALVVGVGIVSAVGLSARETAAAVRAGTMRFTETPIRDHRFAPFTLAEVADGGLPPLVEPVDRTDGLTSRVRRLLRLGTVAVGECLTSIPAGARAPALVVALPELQPAQPIDGPGFIDLLAQQVDGRIDASRGFAMDTGRSGGLAAIARAAEMIRLGQADFAIAGGIDSYRDLYVLGTLDMEKRVKSSVHLDGFVPGEGAAFIVLTSARTAALQNLRPLAGVSRLAQGVEAGHLYSEQPYLGDGLAGTITLLAQANAGAAPFGDVWSSMNGESHWGKEWGVAYLRNKPAFTEDHGMQHPADCVGDVGSAAGPLMVGLAALGMRGGYHRSPALVYCSSDRGGRAALAVTGA